MRRDIIKKEFYQRSDVVQIAKDLLGTFLFTKVGSVITSGMIVETEAYGGVNDQACHAFGDRRTKRTNTMYQAGGIAYVYLCYGMYPLLNIVTGSKDTPHAVLIRAIEPVDGIEVMKRRRKNRFPLADGPGKLTQALGIDLKMNGISLQSNILWIEKRKAPITDDQILAGPRIGVEYAKEDAHLPWRFRIRNLEKIV